MTRKSSTMSKIEVVDYRFGPHARERLNEAKAPDHAGAVAALETFYWSDAVVFAGQEIGDYAGAVGNRVPLTIRTTRHFGYDTTAGRWLQFHHHGSIDQADELASYQQAAAASR
jgi:hypothetical protein